MAIFTGAGVAIVTPMKENLESIMTNWMKCWKSRSQEGHRRNYHLRHHRRIRDHDRRGTQRGNPFHCRTGKTQSSCYCRNRFQQHCYSGQLSKGAMEDRRRRTAACNPVL